MSAIAVKIRKAASEKLRMMRRELGLKRDQMAVRLGVSPSTYYKNEIGETLPSLPTLNRLANDHNISMDWFLCGKGPRNFTQKSKLEALEQELQKTKQALFKTQQERDAAVPSYRASMKTGIAEILDQIEKDQRLYIKVITLFQDHQDENKNRV